MGVFKVFENKKNKQWTVAVNKTNLKSLDPTITSKKELQRKLNNSLKKKSKVGKTE